MTTDLATIREHVQPALVYWHSEDCETYWPLSDGPVCPNWHDTPMYDDRPRKGRKRRMWICPKSGIGYLTHSAFLEHDEDNCGY